MIRLRKRAGLTQEKLAELLHTKKSNISRLESANSNMSPKLSTIEEYAKAVGYKIKINFVPNEYRESHNQLSTFFNQGIWKESEFKGKFNSQFKLLTLSVPFGDG